MTAIKTYVCPSVPARDTSKNGIFLNTPAGACDYGPTYGLAGVTLAYGLVPLGTRLDPGMLEVGYLDGPDTRTTTADVSDGLSNTLLMVERAGLWDRYRNGKRVTTFTTWGGVWGYLEPGITVNPLDGDAPTALARGSCLMNCDNLYQPYGFHAGGVMTVRGDGSVGFLRQTTSAVTLVALIARNGGEVIGD